MNVNTLILSAIISGLLAANVGWLYEEYKTQPARDYYLTTNVICQHDTDFILTEPLDCSHGDKL